MKELNLFNTFEEYNVAPANTRGFSTVYVTYKETLW